MNPRSPESIPVLGTLIRFLQRRESPLETWAIFLVLTAPLLIDAANTNFRQGHPGLTALDIFGSLFTAAVLMFFLRRLWLIALIGITVLLLANGGTLRF